MTKKTKKDLEHDLRIKTHTNKTLVGMLEDIKAHAAKLEQCIKARDLEGAQEYLREKESVRNSD